MRILLAIDGSEQSEAAVDESARQHFPADSEVRVILVVEPRTSQKRFRSRCKYDSL